MATNQDPPEILPTTAPCAGDTPGELLELPRAPDAGQHARRFIQEHFGRHLSESAFGNAKLVASELVNNAVLHGDGKVMLKLQWRGDRLRIEVIDQGTGKAPAIRERAGADAIGGRGLQIVESLSRRWGVFEGTTHVWADVPSP